MGENNGGRERVVKNPGDRMSLLDLNPGLMAY